MDLEAHQCMTLHEGDLAVEQLGLGAAAQRYQNMGYAVLGLAEAAKQPHPLFEHGVSWATHDPRMVPWLWARHKAAGVGIATGQASGIVVIDIDLKHGENGTISFTGLLNQLGEQLPPMPTVATPSGGWHMYFRTPAGWPVPSRPGLLPGVDIKGDGGYVVAPPTRIWVDSLDGGRALLPYRWAAGCPCSPPDAPAWLLSYISYATATGTDHGYGGTGDPLPELDELYRTGLPRGQRNTMLHRLACSLFRRFGTTPGGTAQVREIVNAIMAVTDTSGFGPAEIERTLHSARAFVTRSAEAEHDAYRSR